MPSFGEVLCELREDKDLTQRQLAEKLHMAPTTISSYETGKNLPPPDKLIALADYFGVTTDYLLGRSPYNINPSLLYEKLYENMTGWRTRRNFKNVVCKTGSGNFDR